jgi:hypothetical protein
VPSFPQNQCPRSDEISARDHAKRAAGPQERVYDVAWSGDRMPGPDGRLPPVGNTVDPETATHTNAIGAPARDAFWEDPDFDPDQRAFYYVRVLEIPTPRWTTHDTKAQ